MTETKSKGIRRMDWTPIRVLSIAGSDSGGGAGLQADIKTISALGGYAATAVTAITVQNTIGVQKVYPVDAQTICEQVEAVCQDIKPQAVKIGMLPSPEAAEPLASILQKYKCTNIVLDPVMISTSGHVLTEASAMDNIIKYLFPLASLITPNLAEIKALVGFDANHIGKYRSAAMKIMEWGPKAVLIKGGHASTSYAKDILITSPKSKPLCYSTGFVKSNNLHGTGCTLSAAIAFFLASGLAISQSVYKAKEYTYAAIQNARRMELGNGHGPVNHSFNPVATIRIKKITL